MPLDCCQYFNRAVEQFTCHTVFEVNLVYVAYSDNNILMYEVSCQSADPHQ